MLPVCNNREAVVTLLEHLQVSVSPASGLRLIRLHGRGGFTPEALRAQPEWRHARELLEAGTAAPALHLDAPTALD